MMYSVFFMWNQYINHHLLWDDVQERLYLFWSNPISILINFCLKCDTGCFVSKFYKQLLQKIGHSHTKIADRVLY